MRGAGEKRYKKWPFAGQWQTSASAGGSVRMGKSQRHCTFFRYSDGGHKTRGNPEKDDEERDGKKNEVGE